MLCAIFGREQFQPGSPGNGTGSYWLQRHHILFIWQRSLLSYSNRLVTSADGTLVGGGSVYLLIYGLAIVAILRLRSRKEIFLFGRLKFEALAMYVIWLIFALAFVPRMVSGWPVYSLLGFVALGSSYCSGRLSCATSACDGCHSLSCTLRLNAARCEKLLRYAISRSNCSMHGGVVAVGICGFAGKVECFRHWSSQRSRSVNASNSRVTVSAVGKRIGLPVMRKRAGYLRFQITCVSSHDPGQGLGRAMCDLFRKQAF